MFLLKFFNKFNNLADKKFLVSKLEQKVNFINFLYKKLIFFSFFKEYFHILKHLNYFILLKLFFKVFNNFNSLYFLIYFKYTKYNFLMNLSDYSGNTLNFFSSGLLKKNNNIFKTMYFISMLNVLKYVIKYFKIFNGKKVNLFFNRFSEFNEKIIIKLLRKILLINNVKSYNLFPHNGCRPKKIIKSKRKKSNLIF